MKAMIKTEKGPGIGQNMSRRNTMSNTKVKSRVTKRVTSQLPTPVSGQGKSLRPSGADRAGQKNEEHESARDGSASLALDSYELKPLENHAQNTLRGLEELRQRNLLCDVTIVVGNHQMRAHRTLLATCSQFFHELFTNTPDEHQGNNSEVRLQGISASTAEALLNSMYTGEIKVSEANVRELLAAAASLKYATIEDACDGFLRKRLNRSNCLRMLNLAFTYSLTELTDDALRMAASNFMELSEGFDFFQMDVDQLVALLDRDEDMAPSELDIFRRAISWIEFDKKGRLQYAAKLMRSIRLPLLTPSDIVDHVETVDYLMDVPECQQFIKEALHYHCLPSRQSLLQSKRTCPRTLAKKTVLLAIGGAPRLKSDPVSADVSYLDADVSEWKTITEMHEPRHHHAVAVLGGFLYVAGGEVTNDQRSPLNTAFRFDPRTNSWLQIASMKHRRESFQLGVLNGMLYAVGGRVDQDISLAEVERYNAAVDEWELVAPLTSARRSVAVAAHNGRLYAMGGSGHKRISSRVERYNPLVDQWETRRALTSPRFFAMLASVSNKLILFGGATVDKNGNVVCVRKVECYMPLTDTWVAVKCIGTPRAEAGFAVLDNAIHVVGGYSWDSNKRLTSTECYDPIVDTWKEGIPISTPLTGVGCCSITIFHTPPSAKTPEVTREDVSDVTTNMAAADKYDSGDEDEAAASHSVPLLAPNAE